MDPRLLTTLGLVLDIAGAVRMPSAIGRSNEAPSFRRSAGARFTVIRSAGKGKPALRMAVRTRSRLSRTAESGSPTVVNVGKAPRCGLPTDGVSRAAEVGW